MSSKKIPDAPEIQIPVFGFWEPLGILAVHLDDPRGLVVWGLPCVYPLWVRVRLCIYIYIIYIYVLFIIIIIFVCFGIPIGMDKCIEI